MRIPNWTEPIIHVGGKVGACRVAVVTGIHYQPIPTVFVHAFRERGDGEPSALTSDDSWHYIYECPEYDKHT